MADRGESGMNFPHPTLSHFVPHGRGEASCLFVLSPTRYAVGERQREGGRGRGEGSGSNGGNEPVTPLIPLCKGDKRNYEEKNK